MYYQHQDLRTASIAISQSLKHRKNCLIQANFYRKIPECQPIQNKENITPVLEKQHKSSHTSAQQKKEVRKKAGSIGKIIRNNQSTLIINQKSALLHRDPHYTNKNGVLRQNQQDDSSYKKFYDQNKILNQALKQKIYQFKQKDHNLNSSVNSKQAVYNFNYGNESFNNHSVYRISNYNDGLLHSNEKNQSYSKYQTLLGQYDKKKNFVKEELQAMKQKSSLDNFEKSQVRFKQAPRELSSKKTVTDLNQSKYGQISRSHSKKDEKQRQMQIIYEQKNQNIHKNYPKSQVEQQGNQKQRHNISSYQSISKDYIQQKAQNSFLNLAEKEQQIDKKFNQYQSRLEKHKHFERRNLSIDKENTTSETIKTQNVKDSRKFQTIGLKKSTNQTMRIFVDLLSKQIEKDEQIRAIKNNLKNFSVQQIQKIAESKFSYQLNSEKLKISSEQYDPFSDQNQVQISVEELVRQFINATDINENFWNNLVLNRFSKEELQKIFESLDFNKKHEISLNELARQLSFHMNKTVRGRQIYMIYQRLAPLTKNNFITKLSKN